MSARPDEDEERPWEQGGATRLDFEPHRGGLVRLLGGASLALGLLAVCGGVAGLVGLPLGIVAWVMARQDLAKMRAGLMDRRGEWQTRRGGDNGLFGMILNLVFVTVYALGLVDSLLRP